MKNEPLQVGDMVLVIGDDILDELRGAVGVIKGAERLYPGTLPHTGRDVLFFAFRVQLGRHDGKSYYRDASGYFLIPRENLRKLSPPPAGMLNETHDESATA